MTQTQVKPQTKVIFTPQDVCEMFCPLRNLELEALTQLINETQYTGIARLVSDAIFEGYDNFFFYIFEQLQKEAMTEIQKRIGILSAEYDEIGMDIIETILPIYTDYDAYRDAVIRKLPEINQGSQLSQVTQWFLKQINVTL